MFDPRHPIETDEQVIVTIVDETYGAYPDEEWAGVRETFRQDLQAEFGLDFTDTDIGPGADLPAFATLIEPLVAPAAAGLAVLIAGKPIREGLDNWLILAGRVRRLFTRQVFLSRNGAAALALEAVVGAHGGLPQTLKVVGYTTEHILEPEDLAAVDGLTEIAPPPRTSNLSMARHIFEIMADEDTYRVSVNGKSVNLLKIPTPRPGF